MTTFLEKLPRLTTLRSMISTSSPRNGGEAAAFIHHFGAIVYETYHDNLKNALISILGKGYGSENGYSSVTTLAMLGEGAMMVPGNYLAWGQFVAALKQFMLSSPKGDESTEIRNNYHLALPRIDSTEGFRETTTWVPQRGYPLHRVCRLSHDGEPIWQSTRLMCISQVGGYHDNVWHFADANSDAVMAERKNKMQLSTKGGTGTANWSPNLMYIMLSDGRKESYYEQQPSRHLFNMKVMLSNEPKSCGGGELASIFFSNERSWPRVDNIYVAGNTVPTGQKKLLQLSRVGWLVFYLQLVARAYYVRYRLGQRTRDDRGIEKRDVASYQRYTGMGPVALRIRRQE